MRLAAALLLLSTSVATAIPAAADIVAAPTSPRLTSAFCPAGLPAVPDPLWGGEIPRWTPADGRPMIKVSLDDFPNAVCNDGSPAAMFVRVAPETTPSGAVNPFKSSWHVHFKGGGSCRSFSECRERFCAQGSKFTNQPGLMSSEGWTDVAAGQGLFKDDPRNRFSMMNQVLVGYCSSDTWIGSAPAGTAVSVDPADDPLDVSRVAFMGEYIVAAVLDALDDGAVAKAPAALTRYEMPALTDAERLIVTGDSGGANGARHVIDRIAARYPTTPTVAMLDAGGGADLSDPSADWSATPFGDFDTFMEQRVLQARSFWSTADTAIDLSCKTAHPGVGVAEQACFNGFFLQRDHLSTPTLLRVCGASGSTAPPWPRFPRTPPRRVELPMDFLWCRPWTVRIAGS